MSPSVQDRENRSQMHVFSVRDSCPLWGLEGHPLNLYRGPSGADYGHPMKSDWNSGHSWVDGGHIDWELFWYRDCLFKGWG